MTSALARLRDLQRLSLSRGFASSPVFPTTRPAVCLTRWKDKGLVEAAGERARLYFNKLKCNEVDGSLRIAALLFEYPSAMLCGESVLHAAGWIRRSRPVFQSPSSRARATSRCMGFDIAAARFRG